MRSIAKSELVCSILLLSLVSCSRIVKRMPQEMREMDQFLTRNDPEDCYQYQYNFEREIPRLYDEEQVDSIYDIIDYIENECGPSSSMETTKLLVGAGDSATCDTLVGQSTISSMLRHRAEQEYLLDQAEWSLLYGRDPADRTHERFMRFATNLGTELKTSPMTSGSGRVIGLYYSGAFDSAFSLMQRAPVRHTSLGKSYQDYSNRIKHRYPDNANLALLFGNWNPQGRNRLLGNHPDIGLHLGWEGRAFRIDGVISYRFNSSANPFVVDSLGELVSTSKFNSWMAGVDVGYKVIDTRRTSTDIFAGVAYDAILTVTTREEPVDYRTHGWLGLSVGLRQRLFVHAPSGTYIGALIRYSKVDYDNLRGTDLWGNTLTVSLMVGWSVNETLHQFLGKLNYKGDWRRR